VPHAIASSAWAVDESEIVLQPWVATISAVAVPMDFLPGTSTIRTAELVELLACGIVRF
jgi:hypothetical protein